MSETNFKIEVGKRYVRRDGTISPPLTRYNWDQTGAVDPETNFIFNNYNEHPGQVHCAEDLDSKDLIEEYVPSSEATPSTEGLGGLRYDDDKLRLDLLPAEWELELGRVTTAGSKKYLPRNWEKGMKWMKMIGCMRRHVLKFLLGEHYDKETGCHHLALAAWNMLALMSYDMRKLGEDDRPPSVRIGANFERVD